MVDIVGHVAWVLLWVTPVWFLWNARLSLAFVGLALAAALAPDVDRLLPLTWNGPTHSVAFVVALALVAGAVVAVATERVLTRWWIEGEGRVPSRSTLYVFAAGGLFVGGVSHLAADLLASTTDAGAIALLWPVVAEPIATAGLQSLGDPAWNAVLFVVATALHVGLFVFDW